MWNLLLRQYRWSRPISIAAGACLIACCAAAQASETSSVALKENAAATVELPLLSGWYDGTVVFYITTDVSQQQMAQAARANYVPRLRHALRAPEPGSPRRSIGCINSPISSKVASFLRRRSPKEVQTPTRNTRHFGWYIR